MPGSGPLCRTVSWGSYAIHRPDQGRVLPARQQVLCLDGEDEGGAAGNGGDPRALDSLVGRAIWRRTGSHFAGLRFRADDKMKQQQATMELYKKEKVNPVAGCLPILVQVPVFFALYKVLFVTIEMRHAPFFGWIKDLSAPDPTTVFNLFGLIPLGPLAP